MELIDLQTMVLTWLDDVNGTYFTPAVVQVWINNAIVETQKRLLQAGQQWYTSCSTTSTVINQECYSWPSDFLKVQKFEVITQNVGTPNEVKQAIDPVTLNEADAATLGPGVPYCYYIKKDCFGLRPIPDNIYTLRLTYSYRVSPLISLTSTPDVPTQYHEYIAILATLDGFLRDNRDPQAFMAKKAYYEELMKQDAQQRREDAPRSVVMTQDQGYDFYF